MPYLDCPKCGREMEVSGNLVALKWSCSSCGVSESGLEKFVSCEGEGICNVCGKAFEEGSWRKVKHRLDDPRKSRGHIFFCEECWDRLPSEARSFGGIKKTVEAQSRLSRAGVKVQSKMWLEDDKPIWSSCFRLESGERIEKYCHAHYGWLQWRGNAYEERLTDGILILTNERLIFVSRTGFINKSYLMSHYVGYQGILGFSTGGWIRKHLAIQVRFKGKREVETMKYYPEPMELIPEYESSIREKQTHPLQAARRAIQIEEIPRDRTSCPNCEKPVSPDFEICPYCGARLKETK